MHHTSLVCIKQCGNKFFKNVSLVYRSVCVRAVYLVWLTLSIVKWIHVQELDRVTLATTVVIVIVCVVQGITSTPPLEVLSHVVCMSLIVAIIEQYSTSLSTSVLNRLYNWINVWSILRVLGGDKSLLTLFYFN